MRQNNGVKFIVLIAIIAILTYIAAFGATIGNYHISGAKDIRTGIDIRGGVSAILYADTENPSDDDLETAKQIIEKRLDNQGIYDRVVTIETVNKRILLEIPWAKDEKDFNPQKAINEIGKTALLTFQEVDESKKDELGRYSPTGKIILEGTDVVDTGVVTNQDGSIDVSLELSKDGAEKFAEGTGRLIGKPIAIFMDNQLISAPNVQSKITGGHAVITGQRTAEEAGALAAIIKSGALPFKLVANGVTSVSPNLGKGALDVTVNAGFIAFIIVCLFMIIYYRLPGVLANIALLGLVVIQLLFISWFGISMTLPGIAGIILSFGMGVDANIIIFERIREELRSGKTLRASIDVGFKRAFTAVFDANVTTLISAAILYMLGSGPIRGFAITLGLGVLLSFFTAITASRILLKSVADVDIAKHKWLYGA